LLRVRGAGGALTVVRFDEPTLYAFLMVFVRAGAMMMSTSVLGGQVPPMLRVFAAGAVAVALTPVVMPHIGPPPAVLADLLLAVGREAVAGLLLGFLLQLVVLAFQQAGAIMDLQAGFATSQVLTPVTGLTTTVLANFKSLLAVVLILLLDGHHVALRAFAQSYAVSPTFGLHDPAAWAASLVALVATFGWLALQIATPVAGVSIIIDAAAGLANKAVPQMQVFLVILPVKVFAGVVTLGLGLPLAVAAVQQGVSTAFGHLEAMLR